MGDITKNTYLLANESIDLIVKKLVGLGKDVFEEEIITSSNTWSSFKS